MLGLYVAYTLVEAFAGIGPLGFWPALLLAALAVAALGALIEIVLLRRALRARPSSTSCSPPSRWCS